MATICKNVMCLFGNNINSIGSRVGYLPQCIQNRMKSLQHPYYGFKNHWPKFTMMKDQRKRMSLKEYGPYKVRYLALFRADILPEELREIGKREMDQLPVGAAHVGTVRRCALTSKARGIVYRWRLNRIVFRHLADYNKLAGVQRAMW